MREFTDMGQPDLISRLQGRVVCLENWDDRDISHEVREQWSRALGHYMTKSIWRVEHQPDMNWRAFLCDRYNALCDLFNGEMGSPIEQRFAPWLLFLDAEWAEWPDCSGGPWVDDPQAWCLENEYVFYVQPQAEVDQYKIDFMVVVGYRGSVKRLGIECDGHAFHEKTKEQAARDKKRQRDLLLAGVPVMRFSGSELWNKASECYDQVNEAVLKMAWDVYYDATAKDIRHA